MSINRLNLISLLNPCSSNYNYAPVTDTDASRFKIKNDHEVSQIYNNIDDAWFRCLMLGPLSATPSYNTYKNIFSVYDVEHLYKI